MRLTTIERTRYSPRFTSPQKYADAKLKILEQEFKLPLTEEDKLRVYKCKIEVDVDRACRSLINKYFDE